MESVLFINSPPFWAFCYLNVGIRFPSFISVHSFSLDFLAFVISLILISIYAAIDHLLWYFINKLHSAKQKIPSLFTFSFLLLAFFAFRCCFWFFAWNFYTIYKYRENRNMDQNSLLVDTLKFKLSIFLFKL